MLTALLTTEPLGFPTDTVLLFLGAFIFSAVMDLVQHKDAKEVSVKNAAFWSIFWVAVSLAFAGWVSYRHPGDAAKLFLTGYVLEKTLSIDNLVVFIAIFRFFRIEGGHQHRILYWGILGAIVFRAIFVVIGTKFLEVAGPWAEIVFGVFVGYAAIGMLKAAKEDHDKEPDYDKMGIVRFFSRFYPVFPKLDGRHFFVTPERAKEIEPGYKVPAGVKRLMTPAFVALLVVQMSDILFSFDSVPAVIAVTKEPLLVYTAMIFAILGLRALYFILVVLIRYLKHLEKAVIAVLFFIAFKMLASAMEHLIDLHLLHITPNMSMAIVLGVLTIGVLESLFDPDKATPEGGA